MQKNKDFKIKLRMRCKMDFGKSFEKLGKNNY